MSENAQRREVWLRAEGLHRGFRSEHRALHVLRGVDLEVREGESVAITGASGSGKSTLLNLVGSLDRPDQGSILWGVVTPTDFRDRPREHGLRWGVALAVAVGALLVVELGVAPRGPELAALWALRLTAVALGLSLGALLPSRSEARLGRLRNESIGFVFQQHHLMGDFTALENVMMPARVGGFPEGEARERARNLLVRVGLGERLDHLPGELSGGEQQRVAVARALMNHPRLLLLDEPGGNLDRKRADDLHDLLLGIAREESVAVVAVTHDESFARKADRWLHLEGGRLHERAGASFPEAGAGT
jgi:lipoprotein-releasing system ATP-binding protein